MKQFSRDQLTVEIHPETEAMAASVADAASRHLLEALKQKEEARVILATGNSQIQFLERLAAAGEVDWSRVEFFHMDEYLGIEADHPASFRKYLRERVEKKLKPKAFHYIEGDADLPLNECNRYTRLLQAKPVDLCCLGVGENGHLAFNDPHVADFEDPYVIKLVRLDEECKMQQVREKHFKTLDEVPPYAFTLTIPALCAAKKMLCVAPEERKAQAVRTALEGPVSTNCPASFLRRQSHCSLYLDLASASLLNVSE